jgi:hypothetical protein
LRELHFSIPDDVAVIGFDTHELIAPTLVPSLTTMALPHYQMGKWAVEHLLTSKRNAKNSRPSRRKEKSYTKKRHYYLIRYLGTVISVETGISRMLWDLGYPCSLVLELF